MPNSFSQTTPLRCPQCGQPFKADLWLIVDADERPDLLERIRDGTLHDVTCPGCGHQGEMDAPLVVVLTPPPRGRGEVLFSPAQGTSQEQDGQHARWLLARLGESMGDDRQEEWEERVRLVPREMLPAVLSDDPEAALREMAEQVQREIERLREEDPEAYRQLEEAARQVVAAAGLTPPPTPSPLLTEGQERGGGRGRGEVPPADPFIASVQALLEANSMTALLQAARDHPALLAPEAEARIRQGAENARRAGQEELAGAVEERYRVLRQTVQAAQESGLTLEQAIEMAGQAEEMARDTDAGRQLALAQTLQEFIQARTWDDSRRIVEAHPELLTDEADALLGQLVQAAQAQGDENARRLFGEHRALLRRCREAGIPRAFAEKMLPPEVLAQAEAVGLTPEQALEMTRQVAQMPPELQQVLAELAAGGVEIRSPEDLERLLAERPDLREKLEPVSYTHLTLPTIYSV